MSKHEERIERFKKLKNTKNQEEWEECVSGRENDLYEGQDVDDALEIMEILDEYHDKINTALDKQNHSGGSIAMLISMIDYFHKSSGALNEFH